VIVHLIQVLLFGNVRAARRLHRVVLSIVPARALEGRREREREKIRVETGTPTISGTLNSVHSREISGAVPRCRNATLAAKMRKFTFLASPSSLLRGSVSDARASIVFAAKRTREIAHARAHAREEACGRAMRNGVASGRH